MINQVRVSSVTKPRNFVYGTLALEVILSEINLISAKIESLKDLKDNVMP
jgi:hypothetical protein